jgi:hypothetical protein
VLRAAVEEDLAEGHGDVWPRELANMSKVCNFSQFIKRIEPHLCLLKSVPNRAPFIYTCYALVHGQTMVKGLAISTLAIVMKQLNKRGW